MTFLKLLKRSLWFIIAGSLLLLATEFFHTQHFLSRSNNTEAMVMKVTEQALFKAVTLRLVTEHQTVLESTISLMLTETQAGEKIPVRYNRLIPAQVRPQSFIETWSGAIQCGIVLIVTGVCFMLLTIFSNWRLNKDKKLKQEGDHIYTQFKNIEADIKAEKDGKYPYRIISTWFDPKTKKQYEFKSRHLWSNPNDYIMDQTIKVLIDIKNKKKYLMDLSFLPDNILKNGTR